MSRRDYIQMRRRLRFAVLQHKKQWRNRFIFALLLLIPDIYLLKDYVVDRAFTSPRFQLLLIGAFAIVVYMVLIIHSYFTLARTE